MSKWKEKLIGELVSFSKGKLTKQSEFPVDGFLPLINTDAINGKPTSYAESNGAVICSKSDILMLWDGERSGLVTIGNSGVVGSTFSKLRSVEFIDSTFLFYYLDNKFDWIQHQRTGTGVPHVPKNLNKILWIKYPENKSTQRKIAHILSTADAVIEKTRAAIAKYKAIKQGMLHDLFTRGIDLKTNKLRPKYEDAPHLYKPSKLGWIPKEWEVKEFQSICDFITDGSHYSPTPIEDGEIIANVKDMGENGIDYDSCTRISSDEFNLLKKQNCSPNIGDVLLSKDGTIGRVVLFNDKREIILLSSIAILRPSRHISSEYLYSFLKSEYFDKQLLIKTSGSALKRIVLRDINTLLLVYPKNSKEQEIVSKKIIQIEIKIQTEQSYLHKMEQIKAGLMADLLSGRKEVKTDQNT